jgi:two-component system cell cycle sensor histidine kinase/response regulator CckA
MAEGLPEPGVEPGGLSDMPRGTGTILVVEDEEAVRYLACRVLRGNGYRVLEAGDPAAALQIVRDERQPIDLLVTDIVMPGMSGPALAERMVAGRPDLKVLYITGYAEEAIERQGALSAGGSLLQKPFTAHQLASRVSQALASAET